MLQLLNNGVPLGLPFMDYAYGTCRVPGNQIGCLLMFNMLASLYSVMFLPDRLDHYELCRHMVVANRGCWYYVRCCDDNGKMYSPAEMELLDYTIVVVIYSSSNCHFTLQCVQGNDATNARSVARRSAHQPSHHDR